MPDGGNGRAPRCCARIALKGSIPSLLHRIASLPYKALLSCLPSHIFSRCPDNVRYQYGKAGDSGRSAEPFGLSRGWRFSSPARAAMRLPRRQPFESWPRTGRGVPAGPSRWGLLAAAGVVSRSVGGVWSGGGVLDELDRGRSRRAPSLGLRFGLAGRLVRAPLVQPVTGGRSGGRGRGGGGWLDVRFAAPRGLCLSAEGVAGRWGWAQAAERPAGGGGEGRNPAWPWGRCFGGDVRYCTGELLTSDRAARREPGDGYPQSAATSYRSIKGVVLQDGVVRIRRFQAVRAPYIKEGVVRIRRRSTLSFIGRCSPYS